MSGILALSAAAFLSAPAGAQQWQSLSHSNARNFTRADAPIAALWANEIKARNAYVTTELKTALQPGRNASLDIISAQMVANGRTYLVSIASTRQCLKGANNSASEIEPSKCVVRVAQLDAGKLSAVRESQGCYVDNSDPDGPEKNKADATSIRYQQSNGAIELRTQVGGKVVADCATTIPLPR